MINENIDLKGRNFLKLQDFSSEEIRYLLDLSHYLKKAKYEKTEVRHLEKKNIALIFEKASTRTRCAFEIGAADQGANTTYLGPTGSHLGKKETVRDTARVLGAMYDGIEYRGFGQKIVEELGKYSGVPVWNGLTDEFHPTQILADFLTVEEQFGKLSGIKFVFIGDGRGNMANSLLIGAAKMGLDFRLICPNELRPKNTLIKLTEKLAKQSGAKIQITDNVNKGAKGAEVIYTDVWVSMGEDESVWQSRVDLLKPFQVNTKVMKLASKKAIFMHCLPAFHNCETIVGKKIKETFKLNSMEVTEEVFESSQSIVFEQAENRVHTIKAVMVATLGD